MIKLFLQYVCGVIFAFILWRCIFYVFVSLPTTFPNIAIITNLGVIIYLIAFLALPLVCPLGMYFVDKLIYKSTIHSAWKILFGFLTSIFGVVFFMRILPFFGVNTCDWIPVINGVDYADYVYSFIAALFSLIGYKGVGLFEYIKRNNRTKTDEKIEGLPPPKPASIHWSNIANYNIVDNIVVDFPDNSMPFQYLQNINKQGRVGSLPHHSSLRASSNRQSFPKLPH